MRGEMIFRDAKLLSLMRFDAMRFTDRLVSLVARHGSYWPWNINLSGAAPDATLRTTKLCPL